MTGQHVFVFLLTGGDCWGGERNQDVTLLCYERGEILTKESTLPEQNVHKTLGNWYLFSV